MTLILRMDMGDQLRRFYSDALGVGLLDPAGQEGHCIEDPKFSRDHFCLKFSQGGGGFRFDFLTS